MIPKRKTVQSFSALILGLKEFVLGYNRPDLYCRLTLNSYCEAATIIFIILAGRSYGNDHSVFRLISSMFSKTAVSYRISSMLSANFLYNWQIVKDLFSYTIFHKNTRNHFLFRVNSTNYNSGSSISSKVWPLWWHTLQFLKDYKIPAITGDCQLRPSSVPLIYITNWPGVVACTCNPATLEAEFRNGVVPIPVGSNSSSIGGWIV